MKNYKADDASSESPFYGIFHGENLVACWLYLKGDVEEIYFPEFDDYLLLWKLEVLDNYKNKGYGQSLIDYAKSYNMPIKAIARQNSKNF